MSLDDDLENLATAAISDWPDPPVRPARCGNPRPLPNTSVVSRILDPQKSRKKYIEEWADTDAQQLDTQFDDAIDVVIDTLGRQNGYLPHPGTGDDRRRTQGSGLRLEASIAYLAEDLARRRSTPLAVPPRA